MIDGTWRTLLRHQLGALAATALDYALMILAVERLGMTPAAATALGATAGGVANFLLGRAWIFRAERGTWAAQAARYSLVSGASAGWNALGVLLLHDVPYVWARVAVSLAVSVLWNFPAQRRFVFRTVERTLEGEGQRA
jgi:putative flippase GtrA